MAHENELPFIPSPISSHIPKSSLIALSSDFLEVHLSTQIFEGSTDPQESPMSVDWSLGPPPMIFQTIKVLW